MTPNPSPLFQPSGRQLFLSQSLAQRNATMSELYECALRVFQDDSNPGRIFLAAHSIRELTKDLPKVLDVPVLTDHGRMRDKLDALERTWAATLGSNCNRSGAWTGDIDDLLRKLLAQVAEFFNWRRESEPKMRESAAALFRRIDPAGRVLPQALEKRRADRWIALHTYFNAAAHRSPTTEAEFADRLDELEQILIDCLVPTPSEDFSAIDAILLEESPDAEA
jgi:hypothetical protein